MIKNFRSNKNVKKYITLLVVVTLSFVAIAATNAVSQRIFTIGDSTVQDYNDGWAPRKGWGQVLQSFFSEADVSIVNRAVGGTSSKSFYNSFWADVKNEMQAGDYLFIQFGINDRAADEARQAKGDVFKDYLKAYINEAKAMGVIPVLVSTVRRNAWNADATAYDAYHEHPELVREVAAEMNVSLINLDAKNKAGMEAATQPYSTRYWYNNYAAGEYPSYANGNTDDVHFQEMGALQLAKYVVEGIQELGENSDVAPLLPFIKPQYPVTVIANYPDAGLVTRTETYPQGVNIHMKALANDGHTFINWKDGNENLITTDNLFQFTMGSSALNYTAYFDDEISINVDCDGVINGTAVRDDCGICTGGTSNNTPCTSAVQGENACTVDGFMSEATNAGFVGEGYINTDNVLGSQIMYSVNSTSNQTVTFSFRYANGGTANRNMSLSVNESSAEELTFQPTGSFTTWQTYEYTVDLVQGNNIFELTSLSDAGGPNIDLLSFYDEGITLGLCTEDCQGVFAGNAFIDNCETCVSGTTGLEACTQDCSGEWGGTTLTDDCGVCLVDNSILPCVGSLEAETACTVDGVLLESSNAGYTGDGYLNTDNILGASTSWIINSEQAQTATLTFRYANGGATSRDGTLSINGVDAGTLALASTGLWSTWDMISVNIDLVQGSNELVLTATSADGLANLDIIHFSAGVTDAQCSMVTGTSTVLDASIEIFPNPVTTTLYLSQAVQWQLSTLLGNPIIEGNSSEIDFNDFPAGLYMIKIGNEQYKIVKK